MLSFNYVWCYTRHTTPYLLTTDEILVAPIGKNEWQRVTSNEISMLELEDTNVRGRATHYQVRIHFNDGRPSLNASITRNQFIRQTIPFDPQQNYEEASVSLDSPGRPYCPGSSPVADNEFLEILPDLIRERPFSTPSPDERGNYPETFYEQLRNAARPLQKNLSACRNKLADLYNEHSIWRGLTRPQRAKATLAIIRQELFRLHQAEKIHPSIDEGTMTCIAWKENKQYYPETVNETFCRPWSKKWNRPKSAAHGLGQSTSGTFHDLHERGHFKDFLPEYDSNSKIRKQNFYSINQRPVLQIKIFAHTLNEKRRISKSLDGAIGKYDNSDSCYVKKINYCKACLQQARSGDQRTDCILREEPECKEL